jgi:hypothetical protein
MSINLICFEPWRGIGITPYDNGFGDRIKYWVLAYQLSLIIEDIQIIVEEKYWPELLLIDLPNTTSQDIRTCKKKVPITWEDVKTIMITKHNSFLTPSKDSYYYFNFSLEEMSNIFEGQSVTNNYVIHDGVSKIRLKLPIVSDFIEQKFSDCCYIHLRRGRGTFPTIKFLNEMEQCLTKEIVLDYWKIFHRTRLGSNIHSKTYKYYDSLIEKDTYNEEKYSSTEEICYNYKWVNTYKIVPDSDYFNLILNYILKENPNQKIYISSDIPKKYYSHYYDNFSENIIDKDFYFEMFLNFHKDKIPKEILEKKYSTSIPRVFENIFDLMVGCYSKTIVRSTSNWSKISSLYKKKRVILADMITSDNSLGNWILMDNEIDFIDGSVYNKEKFLNLT